MERFLINQYKKDIEKVLKTVNSKNISLAVEIASIPENIRGYGHVKEDNIKIAAIKRDQLFKQWNSKKVLTNFEKKNLQPPDSDKIMFA